MGSSGKGTPFPVVPPWNKEAESLEPLITQQLNEDCAPEVGMTGARQFFSAEGQRTDRNAA